MRCQKCGKIYKRNKNMYENHISTCGLQAVSTKTLNLKKLVLKEMKDNKYPKSELSNVIEKLNSKLKNFKNKKYEKKFIKDMINNY